MLLSRDNVIVDWFLEMSLLADVTITINGIMEGCLFNMREVERIKTLQQLNTRQINNAQAANRLGLTVRQVQRLKKAYHEQGDQAVVHKLKGRPSGRGYGIELKQRIISLYRDLYADWNFSHFNDSLEDEHGIRVSDHFIYQLLVSAGIKSPRAKKHKPRRHPPRSRKESAGELLQTDASLHSWIILGDKKYALHGMIDDATGIVTALVLCKEETNIGYQLCLADTIRRFGIPECLYTDFRTVFQTTKKLTIEEELSGKKLEATRFANMCSRLGIGIISTRSPQAKGRIERLWETLQDRLTKELLKHGVTTQKEANEYINQVFLPRYNARFASKIDYNRNHFIAVPEDFDYNAELALPIKRKALHGCYIKLAGKVYRITHPSGESVMLPCSASVTVFTCLDGSHYLECNRRRYGLLIVNALPRTTAPSNPKLTKEELSIIRSNAAKKNLTSPWRLYHTHA